MKKVLVIISSFLIASATMGQRLVTSSYVEYTSVSPKTGLSIGAVNYYGWEYGGFYQDAKVLESVLMSETKLSKLPRRYERVFYGAYFTVPLTNLLSGELKLNVRTGVINNENFVITPSLLADFRLNQLLSVGGGLGVRALAPTVQTRITIKL